MRGFSTSRWSIPASMPGSRAVNVRTSRSVTAPLPRTANSGQYSATGRSSAIAPMSARSRTAVASTAWEPVSSGTRVSPVHGVPVTGSAVPCQRSTTSSPSRTTASAAPWAPGGPASRQARSKKWCTEANPGAVVPWTSVVAARGRGRGRTCRTSEVVMSGTPEVVGSQEQPYAGGPGPAHTSAEPAG